jgi:hypothetical protein
MLNSELVNRVRLANAESAALFALTPAGRTHAAALLVRDNRLRIAAAIVDRARRASRPVR